MKRPLMTVTLAGLSLIAIAAGAQDAKPTAVKAATATAAAAPAPALKGDLARGKALTFTCGGCHGVSGFKNAYPSYHVPRIGGQSETYLRNALGDYKKGARKHPTMHAQASSFSEQQVADIAAYLSSLKP